MKQDLCLTIANSEFVKHTANKLDIIILTNGSNK